MIKNLFGGLLPKRKLLLKLFIWGASIILIGWNIVIFGILIIYAGSIYLEYNFPDTPTKAFILACNGINDQSSVREISKLGGQCYAWNKGNIENCSEDQINKFLKDEPSDYRADFPVGRHMNIYSPGGNLDLAWICRIEKSGVKIKAEAGFYSD